MMAYKHLSEATYETLGLKLSLALQEGLFQHPETFYDPGNITH
jgi:hypothetical protein